MSLNQELTNDHELKIKFMQLLSEIRDFQQYSNIALPLSPIVLTINQIDTILQIKTIISDRKFILKQPITYIYEPEELYFIICDTINQFEFMINSNKIPSKIIEDFYDSILEGFKKAKKEDKKNMLDENN